MAGSLRPKANRDRFLIAMDRAFVNISSWGHHNEVSCHALATVYRQGKRTVEKKEKEKRKKKRRKKEGGRRRRRNGEQRRRRREIEKDAFIMEIPGGYDETTKWVGPFTQNVYIHLLYTLRRPCRLYVLSDKCLLAEEEPVFFQRFRVRLFHLNERAGFVKDPCRKFPPVTSVSLFFPCIGHTFPGPLFLRFLPRRENKSA